jgi:hypothetical protein
MEKKALEDHHYFPVWMQNFEGQLKKLHREIELEEIDEFGVKYLQDFKDLEFMDFCILVYQERPDLIDLSQN